MSLTLSTRTRQPQEAPVTQGRRVRRVVRRIDTWTVLKVSLLFHLSMLVVTIVAGVLLWVVASVANVIDNLEKFIEELFALETFNFVGADIFQAVLLGGLVLVMVLTGLTVLMAVLYNLISDVVGGVEVSVLEEEPQRRPVL